MVSYFSDIPVGRHFMCNGNRCFKRSSRTALLIQYNRVFYFAMNTICEERAA